jgi:alpha-tubulin suppressor-like RCC1 family protein
MLRTARTSALVLLLALAACSNERLHLHSTGLVLAPGDTASIRASTLYQPHHKPREVAADSLALSVSDPAVASVDSAGVLTALRPGRVRVTARHRGLEDSSTVVVRDAGTVPATPFRAIAAGAASTCGITAAGGTLCWGAGSAGELGTGSSRMLTATVSPIGVRMEARLSSVAAGERFACGLDAAGRAYCWGDNLFGQLGDGSDDWRTTPVPVRSDAPFASLAVGHEHVCGLTAEGRASCWGSNYHGELGDGTEEDHAVPAAVRTDLRFAALTAGEDHTCALTAEGRAFCWGSDGAGQIGSTETDSARVPVAVSGGHVFASLVAGSAHTCGLTRQGRALCWGANGRGQLGDGRGGDDTSGGNSEAPVPVAGGRAFARVFAGATHTCGLTADGTAWCWGKNASGQLGDGTTERRNVPVAVSGGLRFGTLSAGAEHTCGVAADGAAWCWGGNATGALGHGKAQGSRVPVRVTAPL